MPFRSYYDYDDEGNLDLRSKREDDTRDGTANRLSTSSAGAIQNMTICLCCSGSGHGAAFKKKTLYVQDQVRTTSNLKLLP